MKCMVILLDGAGDRAHRSLKYRTPLQAARTPVLDRIASRSSCGLYHSTNFGEPMPSEIAHLIMFGYGREDYPGRGYLEALGNDLAVDNDDIALLAHLASVHDDNNRLFLTESRPPASPDECSLLVESLGSYDDESVRFHQTSLHDGVLIVRGGASRYITDSDPLFPGQALISVKPLKDHGESPAARETAERVSRFIRWSVDHLSGHAVNRERISRGEKPLNCVVTQRAGSPRMVQPFSQHCGLDGLIIASGRVYRGIARYTGMDFMHDGDTGDPGGDLARRIKSARENLSRYDFIHVHTKMPDAAAHRKDPLYKKKVLEQLDRGLRKEVKGLLDDPGLILVVTADHSTPSSGKLIHSGEPVPIMIHGESVRRDTVRKFDEISTAAGALGCMRGREYILTILNCLDRARLPGFTDDPAVPLYWPAPYDPMKRSPR